MNKRLITVITPVYNEEGNLDVYYKGICETLFPLQKYEFEIIFIDDGSTDKSWGKILDICNRDRHFNAIRLSRNFGSHCAVTAGLDRARGDAAVILACDLQDPVETVIEFLKKWEEGYQIVWGERIVREDAKWRTITSNIFSLILRRWVLPRDSKFTTGSFFLMDRRVIDCYCLYEDNSRLTFAMVAWTGFRQTTVQYHRRLRIAGRTGWTFSKMITAFYNVVLAYSTIPLKIISILSILTLFLTIPIVLYIFYLFMNRRTGNIGWISTILAVFLFSSLVLFQLSILGEYLIRVYKDASRRPLYFVSSDTIVERYCISRPYAKSKG